MIEKKCTLKKFFQILSELFVCFRGLYLLGAGAWACVHTCAVLFFSKKIGTNLIPSESLVCYGPIWTVYKVDEFQ